MKLGVAELLADAAGLWARDLARQGRTWPDPSGQIAEEPGELDSPLWSGPGGYLGGREAVWLGWTAAGVALAAWGLSTMLDSRAEGAFVGVLVVLMWGPWLLAGLGVVHGLRMWRARRRSQAPQAEDRFLAQLAERGGTRPDAEVARAVRSALAEVYGVPVTWIYACDTGRSLSGWLERPGRQEFCAAFLRCWGSGRSPSRLARSLNGVRDVVGLVRAIERATAHRSGAGGSGGAW